MRTYPRALPQLKLRHRTATTLGVEWLPTGTYLPNGVHLCIDDGSGQNNFVAIESWDASQLAQHMRDLATSAEKNLSVEVDDLDPATTYQLLLAEGDEAGEPCLPNLSQMLSVPPARFTTLCLPGMREPTWEESRSDDAFLAMQGGPHR